MIFEIVPMKSVGPIAFGATRAEVRGLFGNAVEFYKGSSQNPTDAFDEVGIHVFYDANGRCVGIEFFAESPMRPFIYGTFPFEVAYSELVRVFRRRGVVTVDNSGFYDEAQHLGVFAPRGAPGARKILSVYAGAETDTGC